MISKGNPSRGQMSIIRSTVQNCFVVSISGVMLCFRLLICHCLEMHDVVIMLLQINFTCFVWWMMLLFILVIMLLLLWWLCYCYYDDSIVNIFGDIACYGESCVVVYGLWFSFCMLWSYCHTLNFTLSFFTNINIACSLSFDHVFFQSKTFIRV